jgi:hypothetical protein
MRKKIVSPTPSQPSRSEEEWLKLDEIASAEVTSEDPNFPIDSALTMAGESRGWRAAEAGKQTIRIIFDQPQAIRRIRLEFSETECERTQEFTLKWSGETAGPFREIVRQQWNFSPGGSSTEAEDYQVRLPNVAVLELTIRPELDQGKGIATLARWSIA